MARLIPNTASAVGPALAVHDNALWAVWRGWHSDESVYFSSTVFNDPAFWEKAQWQTQQMIPDGVGSTMGPGLVEYTHPFPGLWAVWRGRSGDQGLYSAARYDSVTLPWARQDTHPFPGKASSTGPTLAVFNTLLCMVWKGLDGDNGIYFASTDDPTKGWSEQALIPGTNTDCTPQLAATGGLLHLVWRDAATGTLRWQTGNTQGFSPAVTPGLSGEELVSDAGIALAVDPDRPNVVWLVYRGRQPTDGLHYQSFDAAEGTWRYGGDGTPLPYHPGNRLSVAFYHGHAYGAWMEPSNQSIWWSQLPLVR